MTVELLAFQHHHIIKMDWTKSIQIASIWWKGLLKCFVTNSIKKFVRPLLIRVARTAARWTSSGRLPACNIPARWCPDPRWAPTRWTSGSVIRPSHSGSSRLSKPSSSSTSSDLTPPWRTNPWMETPVRTVDTVEAQTTLPSNSKKINFNLFCFFKKRITQKMLASLLVHKSKQKQ